MRLRVYLLTIIVNILLISCSSEKQGLPLSQLYDLISDMGETNNIYNEYPGVVAELQELLEKYKIEGRSILPINN